MARKMRGAELRRIREKLGLSQAKLGDQIGQRANTVARYERGDMPIPERTRLLVRHLAGLESPFLKLCANNAETRDQKERRD